jgi:hypothetical protein
MRPFWVRRTAIFLLYNVVTKGRNAKKTDNLQNRATIIHAFGDEGVAPIWWLSGGATILYQQSQRQIPTNNKLVLPMTTVNVSNSPSSSVSSRKLLWLFIGQFVLCALFIGWLYA